MPLPSALPGDWETYGPGEKIDYYNTMGITPEDLTSVGVPQSDIDWMRNNGYTAGLPQTTVTFNPVETEAVTGVKPGALASVTQEPVLTAPVSTPVVSGPTDNWMAGSSFDASKVPASFDWQTYTKLYPDLVAAGIDTPTEAQRHYALYGATEGRQFAQETPNLDAVKKLYQDILGREADPGGLSYWASVFGSDVSPEERAAFELASAAEIAAKPSQGALSAAGSADDRQQDAIDAATVRPQDTSGYYLGAQIPTFTDQYGFQEDSGTVVKTAAQQLQEWKAEQDRRAALTPAQRAIEDARYTVGTEGGVDTGYNPVTLEGSEWTVTPGGDSLVKMSQDQSGLGAKQYRYDLLDPVTGQVTQQIGVEGPGLLKSFLTNPVTGLILGLALPGVGSAIGSALGATGAAAGALGSGVLNFGLQVAAGADPIDALKGAVLSAGAGFAGAQVSSMLPAELASAGKSAITQLITTGKLDPAALATSVGTSFATDTLAAETGLDKATAGKLVTAGIQAFSGNELAALTSLAQAGLQSGLSGTGTTASSSQDRAAFLEANAAPLGIGALSPNPTEDEQIALAQLNQAATSLVSDYVAAKGSMEPTDLAEALSRLTDPYGKPLQPSEVNRLVSAAQTQLDTQLRNDKVQSDTLSILGDYTGLNSDLSRESTYERLVAAGNSGERANEILNSVDTQVEANRAARATTAAQNQAAIDAGAGEFAGADQRAAIAAGAGEFTGTDKAAAVNARIENAASFNDAYAIARQEFGPNATFNYGGKLYSTATAEERPDLTGKPTDKTAPENQKSLDLTGATEWDLNLMRTPHGFDPYNATTARLLSPQEFKSLMSDPKLGIDPSTLDQRYQAYLYSQAPRVNAGQRASLPIELAYRPPSDIYENPPTSFDEFKNTVLGGVVAGSRVASDAQNIINSLTAKTAALLPNVTAGLASSVTGDSQNSVSTLMRQLGDIASTSGNVVVPELAAGVNRIADAVANAEGVKGKVGALFDGAIENPGAAMWWIGTEGAEELPIIGAAAKVLKATGSLRAAAFADGILSFAETQGLTQEELTKAFQDLGLTSTQAAQAASPGAFAAGAAESIISPFVDLPAVKLLAKEGADAGQTLGKRIFNLVGGDVKETLGEAAQEGAGNIAKQLATKGTFDSNEALTDAVLGGFLGGKTSTTLSLLSAGDQSSAIASTTKSTIDQIGTDGIASTLSVALKNGSDPAATVTSVIGGSLDAGQSSVSTISNVVASSLTNGLDTSTIINSVTGSGLTSSNDISTLTASVIKGSTGDVTANVGSTVTAVVDSAIANGGAVSSTITAAVGSSITAGVQTGGNMASVVSSATSSAITSAVSGGATVEAATVTAVNSAISTGIKSGGDAGAVITAAVDSAIKSSGGDAEAVSSSLQTAVSTALSSGASTTSVTTATINAAVAGGVSGATAASSTIAGVVAAGGNLQQAVAAAEAATGVKVITSQTDGKTVITSTDANTVTKTVVDPASNVTITSTTDLTTNKTTTTIADTGVQQQIDALQQSVADINTNLSTAINDAIKTGQTGDAALQTAINKVASDLGVTKTDLLAQIGKTEEALKNEFATKQQLSGVEANLTTAINDAIKAGQTGDAALQTAINKVASDLGVTKTDLLSQIGKTETALKSQFTSQLSGVETKLTTAINDAVKSGQTGDAALQTAINKVASDLGTSKTDLLAQIGKTEAALQTQFSSQLQAVGTQLSDLESRLMKEINSARQAGVTGDAALETAINKVAGDLGTTKTDLLSQIGKTETALKSQFTTQLGDVSTSLNAAIQSAIAQGKTADTALSESISKVASDLGLTKDQLLQQIGKTETALKSDVKTLSDTVTKINTDLSTEIKSVLKTTQDADAVLNTSINKVASDLGITKDQLLNQIGKTESQLKSEIQTTQNTITQVKTDLTTEIYNAAQTSADADKIITESVKKVADDLGLTKEELLDQIGETELSLKAELSTELAKVSQELGKQIKGIKTGLANQAALAAASQVFRGAASPEDWLGGKLLATKQTGGYQDPLAQFEALQEQAQRMELLQQVAPELAQVLSERGMSTPYYSYGEEPSMDEILGFSSDESSGYNQEPEFKAGGRVSPLNIQMMYAKGGHTREDFRDGKHVAGPGDGQSDDIPAWLADGEFVFPADVVSALGNGSTKAGTEKLYEMMHEIRSRARSKHPKDLPPPAHKSPLDYLKKGK